LGNKRIRIVKKPPIKGNFTDKEYAKAVNKAIKKSKKGDDKIDILSSNKKTF